MPFISKAVADARRAALAARQHASIPTATVVDEAQAATAPLDPPNPATDAAAAPHASVPKRRRGHATKDERGKWLPAGDYPEGFAQPPEHTRFKKGGKGGPGRPKGSKSLDALFAKHLDQKREVTLGGRRQKLTTRELVVISLVKAALEGKDKSAREYALAQMARLDARSDAEVGAANVVTLNESDALSLAEFEQEIRNKIRDELNRDSEPEGDAR